MTPIRAAFTCSKACDIVAEDAFSVLVSIPLALLTSSEVLSCAHGADMSLDMSEKCQLVPVSLLVPTECLESSRQDTDRGKL